MKEEATRTQENAQITLVLPHDTAVALAAAATHYRVLLAGLAELNPTIKQLDEVYHLIMQHPQLAATAKAFLRDTRLVVAGLNDELEGECHVTTRGSEGGD